MVEVGSFDAVLVMANATIGKARGNSRPRVDPHRALRRQAYSPESSIPGLLFLVEFSVFTAIKALDKITTRFFSC